MTGAAKRTTALQTAFPKADKRRPRYSRFGPPLCHTKKAAARPLQILSSPAIAQVSHMPCLRKSASEDAPPSAHTVQPLRPHALRTSHRGRSAPRRASRSEEGRFEFSLAALPRWALPLPSLAPMDKHNPSCPGNVLATPAPCAPSHEQRRAPPSPFLACDAVGARKGLAVASSWSSSSSPLIRRDAVDVEGLPGLERISAKWNSPLGVEAKLACF
jgi:hypothetical protein